MDIRNILNKPQAGEEERQSESDSEKSQAAFGSPKSTVSAPTTSTVAVTTVEPPSRTGQPHASGHERARHSISSAPLSRDFICSTCSKTFARRSDLVRHGTFPLQRLLTSVLQNEYILD